MTAVGVDGWRGRWVAATVDGRRVGWMTHDTFADVLAQHVSAQVVAVDMPMGSLVAPREADRSARTWLIRQGGSGSSIFPSPSRALVEVWAQGASYAATMAGLGDGARISKQAWNLIPSIQQVDQAAADEPTGRLIESHPECSFAHLSLELGLPPARAPVRHSKKTAVGMALRLAALEAVLELPALADAPPGVPADDLLDATVIAWTAQRLTQGLECLQFPDAGPADARIIA